MRFGAWLAVSLSLVATACQGDYPLAPTACDRWCEATQGFACGFYDPAGCVSQCENDGLASREDCKPLFDSALGCFERTPGADEGRCSFSSGSLTGPCDLEEQAVQTCRFSPLPG